MSPFVKVLTVSLCALLLSACDVVIGTSIRVVDVTDVRIRTSVMFDGDAAVALARDQNLDQLVSTFEQRTGVTPEVVRDSGSLGITADVDYSTLAATSDVTGVAALRVVPSDDGTADLEIDLTSPDRVITAVSDAASGDPTGATAKALLTSTRTVVTVEMEQVHMAQVLDGKPIPVEVTGTSATVSQRVAQYAAGTVVVTGTPGSPARVPWVPIAVGTAVAIGGAAASLRVFER